MLIQDHWINSLKSDCNFCHQLGNALTRDVKHVFAAKPELKTDAEAWEWRLGVGVRGTNMYSLLGPDGQGPHPEVVLRLDRAHRRTVKCRRRRRARPASSATSSPHCGMWVTTTPSCTIRFRPTSNHPDRERAAARTTPSTPATANW